MRRLAILTIICMALAGCQTKNIPVAIDEFVSQAELNCDSYSAEDWKESLAEFKRLTDEYVSKEKSYSEAEKKMVTEAVGRYHALLLKDGAEYVKDMISKLPDYINGLANGFLDIFGDSTEDSGKSFEEIGMIIDRLLQ